MSNIFLCSEITFTDKTYQMFQFEKYRIRVENSEK